MHASKALMQESANWTRYRPGQSGGHYESFFQRANDPARPRAFWNRYTLFSPNRQPEQAIGELWAIYFDGETGQHIAVRQTWPLPECSFDKTGFDVRIGEARLRSGLLHGAATAAQHVISWDLSFQGNADPLFLLPTGLYAAKFPSAKSLVGLPLAVYNGSLMIDQTSIEVVNWVGSQNHNWGTKHTDHYAWGQVAGFDNAPDSFLEVATARLKFGPLWTPSITPLVLRHQGQEYALNAMRQGIRAHASIDYFHWHFRSENDQVRIEGSISASPEAFVGLAYLNPPGGSKYCLNTKLASCDVQVSYKHTSQEPSRLHSKNRAAFEILTDDTEHGIPIRPLPSDRPT